jgi:hypothetical protein
LHNLRLDAGDARREFPEFLHLLLEHRHSLFQRSWLHDIDSPRAAVGNEDCVGRLVRGPYPGMIREADDATIVRGSRQSHARGTGSAVAVTRRGYSSW